jgi:hypothetical protein
LLPNTDTDTDPEAGLFKLFIVETYGAKNVISTADESTDTTEMATCVEGKNTFPATLHKTALSDLHKFTKHAVRPTLTELEGPMAAKRCPITVADAEPDNAKAECTALMTNGKFHDKPELNDLEVLATETIALGTNPYPVATFPSIALLEHHEDDVPEVNPARTEFDNPEEEKPTPKTVTLALPLDGMLVTKVEETAPGTTTDMLNDPSPMRDALTTKLRTDPIPEAILKVRELSDTQIDLSDAEA